MFEKKIHFHYEVTAVVAWLVLAVRPQVQGEYAEKAQSCRLVLGMPA